MTWRLRLGALCALAALSGACAQADAGGGAGGAGGAGEGGEAAGVAVTFEQAGPLLVAPGQAVELFVAAAPAGPETVSFLLLGEARDASLDRSSADLDAAGRASVVLQAPSQAAEFLLRAAVGAGPAAELLVRVDEMGTGSVVVAPAYGGVRELEGWEAAVVPRATCAELDVTAPGIPEDALLADGSGEDELVVAGVPVGPSLAVIARSDGRAWGCANAALARPGEEKDVGVTALDRPIDLSGLDLELRLTLPAPTAAVSAIHSRAGDRVVGAAFPPGVAIASTILDAMGPHVPAELRSELAELRATGLDQELEDDLSARGIAPSSILRELLGAGRERFGGEIGGRLWGAVDAPGYAVLSLSTFAGVERTRAGAPADHVVTLVTNPGDTVVLGGALVFLPTRLLGALTEDAALEAEGAATFASVLAERIGCDAIAEVVGVLGDCDLACLEASCRLGLGDRWSEGLAASAAGGDLGSLTIVVSGLGSVDQAAGLVGLAGEWVGVLSAESLSAEVRGDAEGGAAAEPPEDGGEGPADEADG